MQSLVRKTSVFLLIIIFGVVAIAYLVSLAPDLKQLGSTVWNTSAPLNEETEAPAKPSTRASPDPLAGIPQDLRAELTTRLATTSAEFSREFSRPLSRVCQYLDTLKLGHFATLGNPVATDQSVCSSDVISASHPALPNASSVFVWIRGTDLGSVDMIRLKINLTDTETSNAANALATVLLEKLFTWLSWSVPGPLKEAINNSSNISFIQYGISYEVKRELTSIPRVNIFIRADDRSGIMSSDTFEQRKIILPSLSTVGLRGLIRHDGK